MVKINNDNRPDPALLLKQIADDERRDKRGKLKIFFGSSAGVGKTYAMLQAAQRQRQRGVDIVIGIVETHGRVETAALLADLQILPQVRQDYRGIQLSEFDLDAALKRKPAIILMDELAHTNAPTSRHPKRWQDIEELLDAGIDVYTTLNVQHLESLNDIVESITGIAVRETIPDLLFDNADDIVLVDTPPDELLNRLRDGKVYLVPGINERAVQNFFRKTNLLSLRELALRRTAEYVDADTDDERLREGLTTPNTVGERLLVCIGPDKLAAKLVRTARRLAMSLKAPWTAVYIEPPGPKQNTRLRQHIQQILDSAERNGAHIINLPGGRIGDELLSYARNNGITKIIIGKPVRPRWQELLRPNLVNHIIRNSGDIDVYVITSLAAVSSSPLRHLLTPKISWRDFVLAILVTGLLTGLGYSLRAYFSQTDIIMLYLTGAVVVAATLSRGAALLYSLISVSSLNFFFVQPIFSFNVYDRSYWLTFGVMLLASLVISTQAARLREQADLSRQRERKTQIFYRLTRMLTATRERRAICEMVVKHTEDALGMAAAIWLPENGTFTSYAGKLLGDNAKEEIVTKWCFDHGQEAGRGTDTLPSAHGYYVPIRSMDRQLGVLSAFPELPDSLLKTDEVDTLATFASLLASALERIGAQETAEQTRLANEQERLRNLLLSSISHDLRTPLAAIGGAAETLSLRPVIRQDAVTLSLAKSIQHETSRLSRIVSNLLDVTRYEDNLQLNLEPYFLSEIIGSAIAGNKDVLKNHALQTNIADDLPLVRMDAILITQVLSNLLENAAKHTPHDSVITIAAYKKADGILISVSDNGPGIPPGQEQAIFEKFATHYDGDQAKGIGLGLAICQAIVNAHDGRIWAENLADTGAAFHILLPSDLIMPDADVTA